MQTQNGFTLMQPTEFLAWLQKQKLTRAITRVQLHHTWSPSYANFTGSNHFTLQSGMRSSHKARGFVDIAQQFTIFPDGQVCTGRSMNTAPAGITGANTGAICIEIIGNFDFGCDTMTNAQKASVVKTVRAILDHLGLKPESAITYHAWWTSSGTSLGDYLVGKSAKTCPGTAFFGGNTKASFTQNLLPLLKGVEEVTQEQFNAMMKIWQDEQNKLPESEWSRKEGHWEKAAATGLFDGTAPRGAMTREQCAAILGRKGLI